MRCSRKRLELLSHDEREKQPHSLLLRSAVHARIGELSYATQAAVSARAHGADASLALLAQARAVLRMPDSARAGAALYFEGADALTEDGAQAYYGDMRALLGSAERTEWQRASLAERRDRLRRYWNVSAALSGVPVHERLAEHYARLADVFAHGRTAAMGGRGLGATSEDYRALGVAGLDVLLHLRHGDPQRADRIMLCKDVLDVPLPLQPDPADCARTPYGRLQLLRSGETRLFGMRANDRAVAGESYYPPFDVHLAMAWELFQLRGENGGTDLVVAVAVPAVSANALVEDDGVLRASLEVALVDTAQEDVRRHAARMDQRVTRPLSGNVLLATTLSVAPRENVEYRISVRNDRQSAGRIVGGSTDVRSHAAAGLALSDVIFAPQDGRHAFQRGDVRLSLAPGREYRRTESVTLYYEIYGLEENAGYRTEIRLRREPDGLANRLRSLFPGSEDVRTLAFTDAAVRQHAVFGVQEERSVTLNGLAPGVYFVTITVSDRHGATAQRERRIRIVEG